MARSPMVAWLVCASLGTLLFLSGCGSSSSSSSSKTVLEKDAQRFADTLCASYQTCGCMGDAGLADCKAAYGEYMSLMFAELVAEYQGATIDQTKFDACLAAVKTEFDSCPVQPDLGRVEACSGDGGPGFFVGTQGVGDFCQSPASCAAGLGCDEATWTCKAKVAVGQSCSGATVGCQDGLYCNASSQCAAKVGADQACDGYDACQYGLTCAGGTPKCTAPHALTESCSDGAGCVAGAYCNAGTCTAQKDGGESCTSDQECLSDDCSTTCTPASFCRVSVFKM
jgi:hypothetical protein